MHAGRQKLISIALASVLRVQSDSFRISLVQSILDSIEQWNANENRYVNDMAKDISSMHQQYCYEENNHLAQQALD